MDLGLRTGDGKHRRKCQIHYGLENAVTALPKTSGELLRDSSFTKAPMACTSPGAMELPLPQNLSSALSLGLALHHRPNWLSNARR